MQIQLIAVGERAPAWVQEAFRDYAARLGRDCRLVLREIPPAKRGKASQSSQWCEEEGGRMLAAIPNNAHVVALDTQGRQWSSPELAAVLQRWLAAGKPVSLLVGGPDGLSAACAQRADETWSLSKLTFPHPMVRVLIAEQLYRAWSQLHHHPYHRE